MELYYLWFAAPLLLFLLVAGSSARRRRRGRPGSVENVSQRWLAQHHNRPHHAHKDGYHG